MRSIDNFPELPSNKNPWYTSILQGGAISYPKLIQNRVRSITYFSAFNWSTLSLTIVSKRCSDWYFGKFRQLVWIFDLCLRQWTFLFRFERRWYWINKNRLKLPRSYLRDSFIEQLKISIESFDFVRILELKYNSTILEH